MVILSWRSASRIATLERNKLQTHFPAGMTCFDTLVYNDECWSMGAIKSR